MTHERIVLLDKGLKGYYAEGVRGNSSFSISGYGSRLEWVLFTRESGYTVADPAFVGATVMDKERLFTERPESCSWVVNSPLLDPRMPLGAWRPNTTKTARMKEEAQQVLPLLGGGYVPLTKAFVSGQLDNGSNEPGGFDWCDLATYAQWWARRDVTNLIRWGVVHAPGEVVWLEGPPSHLMCPPG